MGIRAGETDVSAPRSCSMRILEVGYVLVALRNTVYGECCATLTHIHLLTSGHDSFI